LPCPSGQGCAFSLYHPEKPVQIVDLHEDGRQELADLTKRTPSLPFEGRWPGDSRVGRGMQAETQKSVQRFIPTPELDAGRNAGAGLRVGAHRKLPPAFLISHRLTAVRLSKNPFVGAGAFDGPF